ncbi:Molybdenum-containing formylmethanofuran dehydrogenase 1 subunit C [uncultured archaeon]|nr:Molybdenum-containing formylmethanofuran dehydrogenase 1 subunit C [uncultured archaeon]
MGDSNIVSSIGNAARTGKTHYLNPRFAGNAASLGLLEKFVPQEKIGKNGKPSVIRDERLARIEAQFLKFSALADGEKDCAKSYRRAVKCFYGTDCTAEDVAKFSLRLGELWQADVDGRAAGLFISAMINTSKERTFEVFTSHLDGKVDCIGWSNRGKEIVVRGDAGEGLGRYMRRGSIVAEGNAGDYVGLRMKGGRIEVKGDALRNAGAHKTGGDIIIFGNAGCDAGLEMRGGLVHVMGNAGEYIGSGMHGGILRVDGRAAKLGRVIYGGDIFVGNDRIVENGKKLASCLG